MTALHFGGNGHEQGAVQGLASTVEMEPGETYQFTENLTSHQKDNEYDDYVACFAQGTLIETPSGQCQVEDIGVGDLVTTRDHGAQPVRWHGRRCVPALGELAPVVFPQGAIGNTRPLVVSPAHQICVVGGGVQLVAGCDEALVRARQFVCLRLARVRVGGAVTYHHLMFDTHEIIFAEGSAV